MGYTLEQFADKCRDALKGQPGSEGRKAVCALVQEVLKDGEFAAKYIPEGTPERKVLYEDPELGFTILAHGYVGAKGSKPQRLKVMVPADVRGDLAALRDQLQGAFPRGYDSPKNFRPPAAERLLAPLTRLNEQLGNR